MFAAVLFIAIVVGLWTVAAVAGAVVHRARLPLRRRVMVNLTDGSAAAGVLWARRGGNLQLREATLHTEGREARVDGEMLIPRERVSFVQVLP